MTANPQVIERSPRVSVSVYQFSKKLIPWAFTQMGRSPARLQFPGLRFGYMLGTGSGRGFSLWPNWQRYALLSLHTTEQALLDFRENNYLARELGQKSLKQQHYQLEAVSSHGAWGGQNPFQPLAAPLEADEALAVLTRATIRPAKLLDFWRHVPAVSRSTAEAPGLRYQLGIGEWPVVQQATFSIWENQQAVQNFAYRQQQHKVVVNRTRQRNWYKEELFARFRILSNT